MLIASAVIVNNMLEACRGQEKFWPKVPISLTFSWTENKNKYKVLGIAIVGHENNILIQNSFLLRMVWDQKNSQKDAKMSDLCWAGFGPVSFTETEKEGFKNANVTFLNL